MVPTDLAKATTLYLFRRDAQRETDIFQGVLLDILDLEIGDDGNLSARDNGVPLCFVILYGCDQRQGRLAAFGTALRDWLRGVPLAAK